MTSEYLKPGQRKILEVIRGLYFGKIERLSVINGEPRFGPATRITYDIKLGEERVAERDRSHLTLDKTFHDLFTRLDNLHEAVVDIEIRHSSPFRLVVEISPDATFVSEGAIDNSQNEHAEDLHT